MTRIICLSILAVAVISGIYFLGKCELLEEENKKLKSKIKDMKVVKKKTQLILIKDKLDEYKNGKNAYTVLRDISNIINDVENNSGKPIESTSKLN